MTKYCQPLLLIVQGRSENKLTLYSHKVKIRTSWTASPPRTGAHRMCPHGVSPALECDTQNTSHNGCWTNSCWWMNESRCLPLSHGFYPLDSIPGQLTCSLHCIPRSGLQESVNSVTTLEKVASENGRASESCLTFCGCVCGKTCITCGSLFWPF